MIHRMMLSVVAMLIGAGLTLAQEPTEVLSAAPTPVSDAVPIVVMETNAGSRAERSFWMSGDYLYSLFRGAGLPPLVTASSAGTDRATAGTLTSSTTTTLFGNNIVNDGRRAGFRLQGGIWLDAEQRFGFETGFMMFEGQSSSFAASSDQYPILGRPYIDANTGLNQAVLVAFPGSSTGAISVQSISSNLYEAHFDLTEKAVDTDMLRVTSLFGYRYYHYNDSLRVRQNLVTTDPLFVPGTTLSAADNFSATNDFQGIDMGFRAQFFWERLTFEFLGKVAFGNLRQEIGINGNQTVTVPGAAPVTQPFGVLALASNTGHYEFNQWSVLPEGGASLSWAIRPNLQFKVGYSVLVLNAVARAANQVDTTINPALFSATQAAPMRPQFQLSRTDMWIQSINFGLVFTY